jgi:hypothetical protein
LPAGLTLSAAGSLAGTPTAAGSSAFTVSVTDAAGCSASRAYTVDVFATEPVSSVAAATSGLAISSAHPCVSVPFVYTRGESEPARPRVVPPRSHKPQLCSPPATAVHPRNGFTGFANTSVQVRGRGRA